MTKQHHKPNSTWSKICGITREEDACAAENAGASAIGLNFYPPSSRFLEKDRAGSICDSVSCTRIALFVDPTAVDVDTVLNAGAFDVLQFHGDETAEFCAQFGVPYIKAFRVREGFNVTQQIEAYSQAWALLLDAYVPGLAGGTGKQFDWISLWPQVNTETRLILAGGLTPNNVREAIQLTKPFGVDVSGGVESDQPGLKDPKLVQQFLKEVQYAY